MNKTERWHHRMHRLTGAEDRPWVRRRVARSTGVKCERSAIPRAWKYMLRADDERREARWFAAAITEALTNCD